MRKVSEPDRLSYLETQGCGGDMRRMEARQGARQAGKARRLRNKAGKEE